VRRIVHGAHSIASLVIVEVIDEFDILSDESKMTRQFPLTVME